MVLDFENTPQKEWTANNWADHYRYNWGINCVPSNGCQMFKGDVVPHGNLPEPWKEWENKPIPLELHEKWKKEKKFEHGIMRVTGNVFHNEELKNYIYASIDCDNSLAIEEFMKNDPIENSKKHAIEMHLGTSGKCHWEFYIKKDSKLLGKASDVNDSTLNEKIKNNEVPAFEVKIGNGVMFGAPSMHLDGTRYEFLGLNVPLIMKGDDLLQIRINEICKKYNIKTDSETKFTVNDMLRPGAIIQEHHNRSGGILKFTNSLVRRLNHLNLPDEFFINAAFWFYKNHAAPGYTDDKIMSTAMDSVSYMKKTIAEEDNQKYKRIINANLEEGLEADCKWLVEFMINNLKIINKNEIHARLITWVARVSKKAQDYDDDNITNELYSGLLMFDPKIILKSLFNNKDVVESLRNLAIMYGSMKEPILLAKDQHMEAAVYLMEKHHVRKHGLDGNLIYFNGIRYDRTTEAFLSREALHLMIRTKDVDIKEVYNYIKKDAIVITLHEMMQHSHVICFLNGVYNIKTREFFTQFSPDYYIFDQIPYNYNLDQPFDTIKKFASDMIKDKKDLQFLYDFSSCCFHPYNGIYFQLGLVGPPGTGKTQVNMLTGNLFDEDYVHDARIQRISDDATVRIDVALGRLNIDGDATDMGIKEVSNTKKFISQEPFTDRAIYDHAGKYSPSSRLMFSANTLYEIPNKNDADAIYDRTKLIRFTKKFRYSKEDKKDFVKRMIPKEEYDGYATFLVNNASDIWERQDTKYTLNPSEARDIWNELGNYVRQFIKKYLVKDAHSTIKSLDIKDKWEEYIIVNNIDKSFTNIEFYKLLEDITGREKEKVRLHDDNNSSSVWGYHGLRLRTDKEIESVELKHIDDT